LAGVGSKLVPVIVTAVPTVPIVGVKLVIVGTPVAPPVVTVNATLLVTVPAPTVTLTGPVVAPLGTVTTRWVIEAAVTVASSR
jgi:hypothetical protein